MRRIKVNSNPVFDDKYLKIKIKSYDKKITTKLHGKAPKERSEYISLSTIVVDSVFKLGKNYYFYTLLEECKYKMNEKV